MANNTIQVPIRKTLEGKEFPESGSERIDLALKELEDSRNPAYEAVYMPELIDARIYSPEDSRIWQVWWITPSIRATGKTKQGNPVVVYAHIPNYFSKSENITKAINQGLVNYAGRIPQNEFQRLLDLEDKKRVFVIPHSDLKNSEGGVISLKKALKHPQTIPFLGGEERAAKYFERHKEVYGENIGIWHTDDLAEEPLARALFVGVGVGGLGGVLDYSGCFPRSAPKSEAS
ncbi:hypothetical protein HYV50_05755 [Candidatus Pacearchaeota archaeon]|nr:hypothetical protein [Candidatus Pacearchaeota archaeon]